MPLKYRDASQLRYISGYAQSAALMFAHCPDILCPLLLALPFINLPEAEMPFYSCSFHCRMTSRYLLFLSQSHQAGVTFVPNLGLGLELCFILL